MFLEDEGVCLDFANLIQMCRQIGDVADFQHEGA